MKTLEKPNAISRGLDKFEEMRLLTESPQWRQDWNLMETTVIPISKKINNKLISFENKLREEERHMSKVLKENTNQVFILLTFILIAVVHGFKS